MEDDGEVAGFPTNDCWKMKELLADLCKAIELNANDWWAKTVRGNVYLRLDQLDPALADLTAAIELKPTFHRYLLRAKVLRKRNEFETALADCQKAIEIGPDNDADDHRRAEAHALSRSDLRRKPGRV